MEKEIWKPIKNYEDYYLVSNFGRILNIKWEKPKIVSPINHHGYRCVHLQIPKGKKIFQYIHRLVAEAFIINPQLKQQVNHIDGNKANNCLYNLEWVTAKENATHAKYVLNLKLGGYKERKDYKNKLITYIKENASISFEIEALINNFVY